LSLSFERVKKDCPPAVDLLHLCAVLAPDTVPEKILTAGAPLLGPELARVVADEHQLNKIFQSLLTHSLIRRDNKNHTLSIHRLVQVVLYDMMEDPQRQEWQRGAVLAVEATYSEDMEDMEQWAIREQWLPHALRCATWFKDEQVDFPQAAGLLFKVGHYLYKHARYTEARDWYQRSLNVRTRLLEPDSVDIAKSLLGLSNTYSELGKYEEAMIECNKCKNILEQKLGVRHPGIASCLNNLAILSKVQGAPKDAEKLYILSLTIRARSLLTSFEAQGKPEEATKMFYTHGLDTQVQSLAAFLEIQEKPEEVIKLYIRCLLNEKTEVRKFAQVLNNLAVLYAEQPGNYRTTGQQFRKYETAERLFHLSLWLQKQHLGHDTPKLEQDPRNYDSDYALSLNDLANLYTEWGSNPEVQPDKRCRLYEMAGSLYLDSRDILKKRYNGVDHPDMAYPFHGRGILRFEQGKRAEAESRCQRRLYALAEGWYKKSLKIWKTYLESKESKHPQVAYALYNLANLYFEQGKQAEAESRCQRRLYALAEECYQESLGIWKKHLNLHHLHTRTCAKKYVKLLRTLNNNEEAQRIEKEFGF
jgi:tetratricopeptide (TPR) repeat protein